MNSVTKKTYAYHKPSARGLDDISKIRAYFSSLHELLMDLCPESRERAVAVTNLEQAAMWAIKSVVINDPESVVE